MSTAKEKYPGIFFTTAPNQVAVCNVMIPNPDVPGAKKPCGQTYARYNTGNASHHLCHVHRIEKDGPEFRERLLAITAGPAAGGQQRLVTSGFTPNEQQAAAFAELYMPFMAAQMPLARVVFKFSALDRETVAIATRSASEKALDNALAPLTGKTGTILVDCGTVYAHHLAVGIAVAGDPAPLLLELAPIDQLGGANAANMRAVVIAVATQLAKKRITVVAVACDNASANVAMMRGLPEFVHQRCFAHNINLLAGDIFGASPLAQHVFEWADGARTRDNGIPKHVATRWNSRLPVVMAARDLNVQLGGVVNAANVNGFIALFRLLKIATDVVQRNDASALDAIIATSIVADLPGKHPEFNAAIAEPVKNRLMNNFLADHILLIAYFSPTIAPRAVSEPMHALVGEMIQQRCWHDLTVRLGVSAGAGSLMNDLGLYLVTPPAQLLPQATHEQYRTAWEARRAMTPRLATLVLALLNIAPTEASIERFFSQLKRLVPGNRSRIRHDNVAAQLLLNTLVRGPAAEARRIAAMPEFGPTLPNTNEIAPAAEAVEHRAEEHDADDDDEAAAPAVQHTARRTMTTADCKAVIRLWEEHRRRPRADHAAGDCGNCGRALNEHDDGYATQCTTCHRWVAHSCEGISVTVRNRLLAMPLWSCQRCRDALLTAPAAAT